MELEIPEWILENLVVGGISDKIMFNNIKHKIAICDITITLKNTSYISNNVFGFGLFTYRKKDLLWYFHQYIERPINKDGKVVYEGISLPPCYLFFEIKNKLNVDLPLNIRKCMLIQVDPTAFYLTSVSKAY